MTKPKKGKRQDTRLAGLKAARRLVGRLNAMMQPWEVGILLNAMIRAERERGRSR
jgi:hypothetical protein